MPKKHNQFLLSFHSATSTPHSGQILTVMVGMANENVCNREHLFCCLQEVPTTPFDGPSSGLGNACFTYLSLARDRCSMNLFQEKKGTEK